MKLLRVFAVLMLFSVISCKKERTCQCTSSQGTYDAGATDDNYFGAKKYCKGLSNGETSCKLKS